ncbi:MAG: hypothetical protein ACRD01_06910, partial [Terriglobales bacterium]
QLGSAHVSSDSAYLFKPVDSWLTAGGGRGGFGGRGGAGPESKPAGVQVLYNLPASYTPGTPVQLTFSTASGKVIETVSLPQRAPAGGRGGFGGGGRGGRGGPARAARLHAGMNSYQWNMRYPDAVEVKGIYHSGFSASVPVGPEVVPGNYEVTLSYGGATQKQPLVIKLAPNVAASQAGLEQRFDLLMRIHNATNQLDTSLNQAIDARSAGASGAALDALNRDVDGVVDFKIRSSEGGLVYPPRLRSWLSFITNQVSMAMAAPTPAMVEVANGYIADATAAVTRLQADTAAANGH